MKNIIKTIIVAAFVVGTMISSVSASTCVEITKYSLKEWTAHSNLIDVPFSSSNEIFINSNSIQGRINAFGTGDYPKRTSSNVLVGSETMAISKMAWEQFFSIDLAQNIKAKNVKFNIYAKNKDGSFASYKLYVNSSYNSTTGFQMGELIQSQTSSNTLKTINLAGRTINNIMIRFDNWQNIETFYIEYFDIAPYDSYDHKEWVDYYIPNTDTIKQQYCLSDGDYTPNGTNNKWQQAATTSFTPKASAIFDYNPIFKSSGGEYDWGRGNYFGNGSNPGSLFNNYDPEFSKQIAGWNCWGGTCYAYNKDGGDFFYSSDGKRAVKFIAWQYRWVNGGNGSGSVHNSQDKSWCEHVTGKTFDRICYKYTGHGSDTRANLFDIRVEYYDAVAPSLQKTASTDYYLLSYRLQNGQILQLPTSQFVATVKGEDAYDLKINNSGIYKIKAVVKDGVGNVSEQLSNYFFIDNTKPTISFSNNPSSDFWHTSAPVMNSQVSDNLSGIAKYSYVEYFSTDGIKWDSTAEVKTLMSNHIDFNFVANAVLQYSSQNTLTVKENGVIYYKAQVTAIDRANNKTVETSPIYKVDTIKPQIEIVSYTPSLRLPNGEVNWTNGDVKLAVKISDYESGLSSLYDEINGKDVNKIYSASGESQKLVSITVPINILPHNNYKYKVYDRAGNYNSTDVVVDNIDKVNPEPDSDSLVCGSLSRDENGIKISFKDGQSGVSFIEYRLSYKDSWGAGIQTSWNRVNQASYVIPFSLQTSVDVDVRAYDKAGNMFQQLACKYTLESLHDADISLVDYNYLWVQYRNIKKTTAASRVVDTFIEFLENDVNEISKNALNFIKSEVKAGKTKAEAVEYFKTVFSYFE